MSCAFLMLADYNRLNCCANPTAVSLNLSHGGDSSYKTPVPLNALRGSRCVLFSPCYDVHRRQANYDYHADYDAGYVRFGRVEKQLD